MSIIQTLIGAIVSSGSGGGGGTPNAYAGYGASPTEGFNTDITVYVENWNGSRIWWSVVGKGSPAADPNTDMIGTLSGFWDPGAGTLSTVVTNVGFIADETAEGTEYWGVNLGTTEGGSDIWTSNAWSINEPLDYNAWTIEWFQKSNPSQPSTFPRVFGISTYPTQPIGFSMEGIYYGWVGGAGIGTSASVTHNTWQHWAIVCDGTLVSIYKDGSRVASSARANYGQILNTTSDFYVGIDSSPANGYKGLITNFRVVKGLSMYDAGSTSITVPTAPLVNNPFTELLLRSTNVGNVYTDSSSRARTAAALGSNAFSADTPFIAPTPAGPYTQSTGQTGGGGAFGGILDFAGSNYNADLLNIKTGWTVTNGVTSGQVTEDAYEIIPGTIRIGVNFEPAPVQATWTFTQYQVGGSIEFYTSSYGMLLYTNGTEWALDGPNSTYTLTPAANNVNEGSSLEFTVGGTNIPDGNYYWTVTNSGDFGTTSGVFPIGGNSGTFSMIPTADATTEGAETFTASIRSGSITGTVLATSEPITINDTSLTKLQLTSGTALGFNGTDNRHVIVAGNQSDWNLGDNWTIEWWQKIPVGASGFLSVLCQDANVPTYSGIDVFVNAGNICMFNGNINFSEAAATRGEWNHIAIQKNIATGIISAYINGVSQSVSGSHPGTIAPSSPLDIVIGSRTADGGVNFYDQYFNGQLANIRISNSARYSTTFTPPTTVVTDAGTLLGLDGSTGGGGMLTDESTRHTLTNNGATVDTIA